MSEQRRDPVPELMKIAEVAHIHGEWEIATANYDRAKLIVLMRIAEELTRIEEALYAIAGIAA